jgi:hypothetical protein
VDSHQEVRRIYKAASKELLTSFNDDDDDDSESIHNASSANPFLNPAPTHAPISFEMELINQLKVYNENVAGIIRLLGQKRPLYTDI